ncbi:MAG TPA: hypothetical protein VEV17_14715 [Bryobacteraceae bacterium]|nr:hypothetical protein [Bryobacteraceae bacterium]
MSSNGSPQEQVQRRLTELRNGLLGLHKTLLESERATYERDIARIASSGELLKLVLYDPWFAWLHELSEFVVLIDETLDAREPPGGIDAERLIAQAWDLLAPDETGTGFARRYFEALQRDPDVVLAHAKTRKLLDSLT